MRQIKFLRDLGTAEEIIEKYKCDDPMEWARDLAKQMEEERPGRNILVPFNPSERIQTGQINSVDIGYLFLQQVYYDLRIDLICKHITKRRSFFCLKRPIISFVRPEIRKSRGGTKQYLPNRSIEHNSK